MPACNQYKHNPVTGECDTCSMPEAHHPHKNTVGDYTVTIYNRENKKHGELFYKTYSDAYESAIENHNPPHTTTTIHHCMYNSLVPRRAKWEKQRE